MMRVLRIFLLLLLCIPASHGLRSQDYREMYDSLPRDRARFDSQSIAGYREDPDFNYETETVRMDDPIRAFLGKLLKKIFGKVNDRDVDRLMDFLFWVLIILGALLLIYLLYRADRRGVLERSDGKSAHVRFLDFDGSSDDLEKRLLEAEKNGNYPLALRLLFIQSLHKLENAGFIRYKKEKTNGDYYIEITDPELRSTYGELRYLFDYSNYGAYPIEREQYDSARELHRKLTRRQEGGQHG